MARNRVDVWGIDQGWALVPAETTDFDFMADWGMQRQIDDLRSALAIAREVRRLTGESGEPMNLLGYSSGGITGYALLDYEVALPEDQRQVEAFVVGDIFYKTQSAEMRSLWCADVDYQRELYEDGVYGGYVVFQLLGNLARTDPDGESPILEGFTNLQAALFFGCGNVFGVVPVHYLAGAFDESGMPVGLQYMDTEAWLDFLESAVVWEPTLFFLESEEISCDITDSPFDDLIHEITVPVFNWGAAGGFGPYGSDTLPLLGSENVSDYIVTLRPPEEVLLDFAHIDLFTAENAHELAWDPLLDWMKQLRKGDGDDEGDDEMDDEHCDGVGGQSAADDDSPVQRRHDTRRLGLR